MEKLRDDKEDINKTNRGRYIKLNIFTDSAIKRLLEKERGTEATPNLIAMTMTEINLCVIP